MSEEDVLSPNTRLGSIKRKLAKPPKEAERLRLNASTETGGTSVQLGEWPIDEVSPSLAVEIDALMREHATTLSAYITGTLAFVTDSGTTCGGVKVLKYRPDASEDDVSGDLASLPEQLTGDARSQSVQAQKHLEVMQRMMLTAMGGLFVQMRQNNQHTMHLCEILAERHAESESRERKARTRADDLEDQLREAMNAHDSSDESQTSAAQERIVKLIEPILPMLMQRFLSSGNGTNQGGQT